jgi:5-methylcytosine-specific restriction enzyme subunit McrC
LHHDLRKRVRSLLRDLASIGDSEIATDSFRKCQVHSNNRFYRFLLNVCQLIHQASLVDQNPGSLRFRDFERDERRMARVFQDFLFNFMRIHQPDAQVRREQIGWKAHSLTDPGLALLPRMETDISLRRGGDRLIIDAKYYQKTLTDYYDAPKIHGENLYQLLSYLSNAGTIPGETLSGMLIYPRVDRTLRERYTIQGYTVYISTLDLSQEWRTIEHELREIMSVQQLRLQ